MVEPEALHIVVASRAVAPQHGFGGLERAVAAHIRALARRGARLTIFTQPPEAGQPPPDDCGGRVAWRVVPYRRVALPLRRNAIPDRLLHYPSFARRVGREAAALARRERVDVVHGHGLVAVGYAGELRAAGRALPLLVLNPHGLEEFSRSNRAKWLAYAPFRRGVRRAAAAAAAVIATDRALVAPIREHLRVPPERIATIPNGVEVADLDALVRADLLPALRARHGLTEASLTLISVARLERNKGLHEGLQALHLLRDRLPAGWRWLIVGAGSEAGALRAQAVASGLASNVVLAGALPDEEVQTLLSGADLCLVPSLYEGSSLAALEALARRRPVVATTAGGLPDKVIPGQTGFLAPPGNPTAIAAAIAQALDARPAWPAYGERARALVEAEFDWAALAGRYLALYARLAGLGGAP